MTQPRERYEDEWAVYTGRYAAYAGFYGDHHWAHTAFLPCGKDRDAALAALLVYQQTNVDFCGMVLLVGDDEED